MIWILPLLGLIFFEIVADIFAKEYSLRGGWKLWLAAIIFFIVCNIFWLSALKNGSGLARGGVIFSVSTAIIVTIIGLGFYNESLRPVQLVGIGAGILSITLIFWK